MTAKDEEQRHLYLAALDIKTRGPHVDYYKGDKEAEKIASEVPMETLRRLALSPSEGQRKQMQKRGKTWEEHE